MARLCTTRRAGYWKCYRTPANLSLKPEGKGWKPRWWMWNGKPAGSTAPLFDTRHLCHARFCTRFRRSVPCGPCCQGLEPWHFSYRIACSIRCQRPLPVFEKLPLHTFESFRQKTWRESQCSTDAMLTNTTIKSLPTV